jgi:hypothetical protein
VAAAGGIRFDTAQTLNSTEKAQARSNMGLATVAATGAYNDLTGKPDLSVYALLSSVGAANGIAQLDSSGKVPVGQLPTSTTDTVTEGSTNLYFTNARARAAISVAGGLSYNASTGVITGPTLATVATSGAYGDLSGTPTINALVPTQTGNAGKYLLTDGTSVSWASVDALPSQTGNSGKYLTTDGTTSSWALINAGAVGGGSDKVFWLNDQVISSDYTVPSGKNASSAGPITINSGVTVTVSSGSTWVVV